MSSEDVAITFSTVLAGGVLVRSPVPVSDYPLVFLVGAPTGSVLRHSLQRNVSCQSRDPKVCASAACETLKMPFSDHP